MSWNILVSFEFVGKQLLHVLFLYFANIITDAKGVALHICGSSICAYIILQNLHYCVNPYNFYWYRTQSFVQILQNNICSYVQYDDTAGCHAQVSGSPTASAPTMVIGRRMHRKCSIWGWVCRLMHLLLSVYSLLYVTVTLVLLMIVVELSWGISYRWSHQGRDIARWGQLWGKFH